MSRMHAPEDEKRSVVPVEAPDYLRWLTARTETDLRGMLHPFEARHYLAAPRPPPPRKSASNT